MQNLNKAEAQVSLPSKDTKVKLKSNNWFKDGWVNLAISTFKGPLLEIIEATIKKELTNMVRAKQDWLNAQVTP